MMSPSSTTNGSNCVQCGAALPDPAVKGRCWLCGGRVPAGNSSLSASAVMPPPLSAGVPCPDESPWTFSLASLMLTITLIAVCLGAITQAPGFGVPLTVFVVPALLRTWSSVRRQRAAGEQPSGLEKVGAALVSLGAVLLAGLAAGIAACASCFAVLGIEEAAHTTGYEYLEYAFGAAAAVYVIVWIAAFIWMWPRKRRRLDSRNT